MIEINLLPGQNKFGALSGISATFSVINFKFLIVALIIHFAISPLIQKGFEVKVRTIQSELGLVQKAYDFELKKNQENLVIVRQAEELEEREKKLTEKLDIVKKILKQKKNPMGILLYMAKNIPQDVWVTSLKIENDQIEIVGQAQSYKSIGSFIESLQSSIFFGNKMKLEDSSTITEEATGRRTEQFKLVSNIEKYN